MKAKFFYIFKNLIQGKVLDIFTHFEQSLGDTKILQLHMTFVLTKIKYSH